MKLHDNARIGKLSPATHGTQKFHAWVLDQDEVWIDRHGYVHEVAKLHPEYALNILLYLYEHQDVKTKQALVNALKARILPSPDTSPEPPKAVKRYARPSQADLEGHISALRVALIQDRPVSLRLRGQLERQLIKVTAMSYAGDAFRYHYLGRPASRFSARLIAVRSVHVL